MLSSVVVTFPGTPRLLQCTCAACGSPSATAASLSVSRIARGVTLVDPIGVSSSVRSRAPRFHSSTPPGFTTLIA
jgi:hypothetical protein